MKNMSALKWVAGSETPAKTYITRVFNLGTWDEWLDMKRSFSPDQIREAVFRPLRGQWNPRGKAFAEILFDCRMPGDALISFEV